MLANSYVLAGLERIGLDRTYWRSRAKRRTCREQELYLYPPFGKHRSTERPLSYQTRGIVGLAEELSPHLGTDTQLRAAGCIVALAVCSPIQRYPGFKPSSRVLSSTSQVAHPSSRLVDIHTTPEPASQGHLFIQAATALRAISCRAWLTHRVRLVGDDKLNADPRTFRLRGR